ncbi:MAG: hypothetical protein H0W02_24135 [Ktedonobacteraceae bacterium]|nr:hypothetical protein [Ktedonobacteraceae bacterium]
MADSQKTPGVQGLASSETDVAKDLIVAEYNNLYAERFKRLDIRLQLTQFALTVLGVLLTVGFSVKNVILIYAYPLFVLVLSITYLTNAIELRRINKYIRTSIEPRVKKAGDEAPFGRYTLQRAPAPSREPFGLFQFGTLGEVGAKLLFLLSAVIAVLAGKLAAQLYGGDNATFFWLACIVTAGIGVLLFLVSSDDQ